MSKQAGEQLGYIIWGAITSGSIGFYFLQLLGFFVAGIIGAIGGWVAQKYIIPYLNKFFKK